MNLKRLHIHEVLDEEELLDNQVRVVVNCSIDGKGHFIEERTFDMTSWEKVKKYGYYIKDVRIFDDNSFSISININHNVISINN